MKKEKPAYNNRVLVLFTDEQLEKIKKAWEGSGVPFTTWIRSELLKRSGD